jgi:5-amino-6-(5-phosphoribosylamino)uracil reductase
LSGLIKTFNPTPQPRWPKATVVLAMSADGKIADRDRAPARFGSPQDKHHLEEQIAQVDAVLFGGGTLRAYGSTLRVVQPDLLQQRYQQGKPPQPVHIVCSRTARFEPTLPFFQQPVPRWLLTTRAGAELWHGSDAFEKILVAESAMGEIDWEQAFDTLALVGCGAVAVLGGGELVASLVAAELIDDFWITVCPFILGGRGAPTPVEGSGLPEALAIRLDLLEVRSLGHEVFLHYRMRRSHSEFSGR